jgi:MFS family permease
LAQIPEQKDSPSQIANIRPWASLLIPQFRLLWGGFAFGSIGLQMRQTANLWVIWEISGSAFQLGLLGTFRLVPHIIFSLVGGTLADMVDRKKLLLITQTINLFLATLIAVLAISGNLEIWHIYAVTLGSTMVNSFDNPARIALIPMLVPRTHLMNALTLNTMVRHSSRLFGPTLAGIIIAWQGVPAAYVVNTLGFLPVIAALFFLKVPRITNPQVRTRFNLFQMFEGLRFIWSTQIVLSLVILDTLSMVFTSYQNLMPIFADEILHVGPTGFGGLMSAPGVGFLIGAAILLMLSGVRHKGMMVLVSMAFYAGAVALFAISTSYVLALVLIAFASGFDAIGTVLRQTIVQLKVPEEVRGRATAGLGIFTQGAPSLGQTVTGGLASVLGAPGALLVGALVCSTTVIALFVGRKDLRTYQE